MISGLDCAHEIYCFMYFKKSTLNFALFNLLGLACALTPWIGLHAQEAGNARGAKLWANQCASCHGAEGEGEASQFEDPLHGDLSLNELTRYIVEAMPEEDPDSCVGEDARLVAEYAFNAFYSEAAQRKLNEARVELSRLTVRQYRESVADLIGSFFDPIWIPEERGLEANYFASRHWTEKSRLSKQVDSTIDYGDGVPHFDPTGKYENVKKKDKDSSMNSGFSVYWKGGLIAPETGEYEIIVESKNGFELKLNDFEAPLIDRVVRSDEVVEHKAKIFLLGGRNYQFNLEMYSRPDPPAKLRLLWKPPGQRKVVIPSSALTPHGSPEVAIVSTKFPADDASFGFERGISVSQQWDAATTDGAIQAANWVADRIHRIARAKGTDEAAIKKIRLFCHQFVSRAFSKQLNDHDRHFYVDQHFEKELSIQDQVKRVVIMTLKSPRFLFPGLEKREKNHELIRRMALCLWDSVPDKKLYQMAFKGEIASDKKIEEQLYRMLYDPRSKNKLHSFFHYWLESHKPSISKDKELYPDFNDVIASDLKTSLELYLSDVVWDDASDFRQLFLADYLFLNERLAKFYNVDFSNTESSDEDSVVDGFKKVKVDPSKRAGILTHPYLMAGLAYHKDSSPIHRGVFVAKRVLGRRLRQPPNDVKPLTEEFNPTMTTRERVEHQTKEATCMNCHSVINPLGFSLENFDAVGRFRTEEKKKKIDVSTVYRSPQGEKTSLNGPRDLANFLANNEMAQRSFIRQLFNHYAKQSIDAYGDNCLDELQERFVANGCNVKDLLVHIAMVTVHHEMRERD